MLAEHLLLHGARCIGPWNKKHDGTVIKRHSAHGERFPLFLFSNDMSLSNNMPDNADIRINDPETPDGILSDAKGMTDSTASAGVGSIISQLWKHVQRNINEPAMSVEEGGE